MKAAPGSPLYNTIRNQHVVSATPRLIVEWNYNTHVGTTVTNTPNEEDEGYDVDLYPIESISWPQRPTRGIVKARTDQAKVSKIFEEHPNAPRYYAVDEDDKYKYWSSPYPAGPADAAFLPLHTDSITTARPAVQYNRAISTNKIVVGFETSWASPVTYEIFLRYTETGAWNSIGSNFAIDGPTGQVTLYYNGTSWSPTVNRTAGRTIWGIQVRVYRMNKPLAYLSLIEVSARLERDLSQYMISCSDDFNMSDISFAAPLGAASSNSATVSLFNDVISQTDNTLGLLFNNDNLNSPYQGLIDSNVRFTLGYEYDCTASGGGSAEYVQAFTMWTTVWNNQLTGTVEVQLQDSSKLLMERKPAKTMYEKVSVGGIVWRLCDMVGFSRYNVEARDDDRTTAVPVYYTDGSTSIWEEFESIAEGTQSAIYFDAYDVLQVQTRRAAYNETRNDWTLRGEDSGAEKADIIDIGQTESFEANSVKVSYQATQFTDYKRGLPRMEVVWSPENTVALRACPIVRDINADDLFVWLAPKDARIWPWSGIMNVQGELIRYDGKQYIYYTSEGRQSRTINSEGELRKVREQSPATQAHKNHFTGALRIVKRGLWNTERKVHLREINGWNTNIIRGPDVKQGGPGLVHHKNDSNVSIRTRGNYTNKSIYLATRGQSSDAGYYYYGTRMKFGKGAFKTQRAGIVFQVNGTNGAGYYIDIVPTAKLGTKLTKGGRKQRHEIIFYSQNGDGSAKLFGGISAGVKNAAAGSPGPGEGASGNKGTPYPIRADKWYDIDVVIGSQGNDHRIQVYLDGALMIDATVPGGSGWKQPWGGKFGMFARGHTYAFYEYMYAIGRDEGFHPDSMSFMDRVDGGYISDQWMREWVFRTRKESKRPKGQSKKETEKYRAMFMDEFGPIAHEVREFEVDFSPAPVLHSKLYMSNDWSAVCPEYRSNSFGASFIIANAQRHNIILNGSDSISFPGSQIDQALLVYGRALVIKDAESITVKNDGAIRRRGLSETEITSKWIQSKEEAQQLGDWINLHWSEGNDELQVTVFGNPLIEVGDVVKINFPEKAYLPTTHKFFVVGTSTDFQAGLQTQLTLRRCVI